MKSYISNSNQKVFLVQRHKKIYSLLQKVQLITIRENGEYLSPDSFKYCSRVINGELKIKFDYHSLRHTHATTLIENGANVKDVQNRLGHFHISTTLQTYAHDTQGMQEQSVELFEKAASNNLKNAHG